MATAAQIQKLNEFIESKKFLYIQYFNRSYGQMISFYADLNGSFTIKIKPQREDGTFESFDIIATFLSKERAIDYFLQEGGQLP